MDFHSISQSCTCTMHINLSTQQIHYTCADLATCPSLKQTHAQCNVTIAIIYEETNISQYRLHTVLVMIFSVIESTTETFSVLVHQK